MLTVHVRLYEELNHVLPPSERKRIVTRTLPRGSRLSRLLDALGISSEAIDLALVNSRSVSLQHELQDQDLVSLYPEFESFDIRGLTAVRDIPIRNPGFIAEKALSDVACLLRNKGYDCICLDGASSSELARRSLDEKRILLTTDPDLARVYNLDRCFCLRSRLPEEQLEEVVYRFQLE
jgi:hypothetical protein